MNKKEANQLISSYMAGDATRAEEQKLRAFFRSGNVPEELHMYASLFAYYDEAGVSGASEMDPFAKIDFEEDGRQDSPHAAGIQSPQSGVIRDRDSGIAGQWSLRIAAGIVLLLAGFWAGQWSDDSDYASNRQVVQLQEEVQQMKRVLMNENTYRQASAGERLAAVSNTVHMPAGNERHGTQITDILIHVMNNDENVNVRMAAAEALFRFREEAQVRQALVASLGRQEEPLMQITLIDMLVELKAKNAVQEMEKMLVRTDTRDVVRNQLQAGIAELKI